MYNVLFFSLTFDLDLKEFNFEKKTLSGRGYDDYNNSIVLEEEDKIVALDIIIIDSFSSVSYYTISEREDTECIFDKLKKGLINYNSSLEKRSENVIERLKEVKYSA